MGKYHIKCIYKEKGYESRADYLRQLSLEKCVALSVVQEMSDMLGMFEDFDGLPAMLDDYVWAMATPPFAAEFFA